MNNRNNDPIFQARGLSTFNNVEGVSIITLLHVVMEEFWRQAELERERGLPLTVPARDATDLAQFQKGFIAFIRPLFAAADRIGGVDMSLPLERLEDTARRWQTTGSRDAVDDDVRE